MTDDRFNGWSNWDTWNAHLWLSNDEASYHAMTRAALLGRTEAEGRELIGMMGNPDDIDLDAVDWGEIREAFDDE